MCNTLLVLSNDPNTGGGRGGGGVFFTSRVVEIGSVLLLVSHRAYQWSFIVLLPQLEWKKKKPLTLYYLLSDLQPYLHKHK